eukprot:scaffold1820_cov129-Cylindrotheca_fusiformis.AAC.6
MLHRDNNRDNYTVPIRLRTELLHDHFAFLSRMETMSLLWLFPRNATKRLRDGHTLIAASVN